MIWWQILLIILLIVFGAIVIRLSFNFDINRCLESRRKIKIEQLKNICPHCNIAYVGGNNFSYESFFSSRPGTINWRCSQCDLIVGSKEDVDSLMEPLQKDPTLFLERKKRFVKMARKLKLC